MARVRGSVISMLYFIILYSYLLLLLKSLVATIRSERLELLQDAIAGEVIPAVAPLNFFDATPKVDGIGEPTTACFFTSSSIDPTNWYTPPPPNS